MFPFRRSKKASAKAEAAPSADERLLQLSRELRGSMLTALVEEADDIWGQLSERLDQHSAQVAEQARGDIDALEKRIHEKVTSDVSRMLDSRVEEMIDEKFSQLTERLATILVVQRQNTEDFLQKEFQNLREEVQTDRLSLFSRTA